MPNKADQIKQDREWLDRHKWTALAILDDNLTAENAPRDLKDIPQLRRDAPLIREFAQQKLEIIAEARRKLDAGEDWENEWVRLESIDKDATLYVNSVYPFESPEIRRGQKSKDAGQEGHETTHGTPEQKQARWREYQTALDKMLADKPHLSLSEARRRVARDFNVSEKTIKRHTHDPRSKHAILYDPSSYFGSS